MILKSMVHSKKTIRVNLKVTPEELTLIQNKAILYTGGNVSEWIRYAATHAVPPKSDVRDDPAAKKS